MFLFVIPVLLLTCKAQSQLYHPSESAASEAQIRFAIENKYDDTGPGAKGPEYAYGTFKNLDDALIGYLDDPDTKLSEYDKAKGLQKLYKNQYRDKALFKINALQLKQAVPFFKSISSVRHEQAIPTIVSKDSVLTSFLPEEPKTKPEHLVARFVQEIPKARPEQLRVHKFRPVKGSPLNLAHFTKEAVVTTDNFGSKPSYTYSYGVHDKMTGDSKSAHETRDGDKVTGFYTFMDPDGKQRTVHYTADDKEGFKAIVRRTVSNSQ